MRTAVNPLFCPTVSGVVIADPEYCLTDGVPHLHFPVEVHLDGTAGYVREYSLLGDRAEKAFGVLRKGAGVFHSNSAVKNHISVCSPTERYSSFCPAVLVVMQEGKRYVF